MAAIFQLRRGTTGDKPTLTAGELYVDQTSENLIVGVNGSKEITLLKLNDINTGSLTLTGDIRLSGSIYLGDSVGTDNIAALGLFTTNLVPSPDNGIDIGTTSAKWRNVYATSISGAIAATNGVVSGSSQIIAALPSGVVSGSSQVIGILTPLNSFSASILAETASLETRAATLGIYTASVETRFSTLSTLTGSNLIRLTNLESKSSSVDTQLTTLSNVTSSLETRMITLANVTGSIHSYTSSLKAAIALSGTDVTINGNLTVAGTTTQINSTTLNIGDNIIELNYGGSQTTSGIITKDATGASTTSGSLLWDASLDYWKAGKLANESKVLLAGGDSIISSSMQLTQLNSFSASVTSSLVSIYQTTSSLNLFSASVTSSLVSIYQTTSSLNTWSGSARVQLSNLESKSASVDISITNINTTTASLNTSVSNLNTFSGSENTKSTTLQTYTASVNQTTSSLNQYTASANAWSGTIDTRFNTLQQVTSSLQSATGSLFVSASRMTASIFAQEGRITYLEGIAFGGIDLSAQFSAIQQITSSLHSYTSSANIRFTNIEAATSSYETKGRGIVSGSSQILGGSGVWSGSAQMPVGVVSGSSQITYTNISSIPAGIVSGAAQVTPLLPNGVISGSSQISSLFEPIASSTRTLISGSSQVLGGSGIHSGSYTGNNNIVSSSSQITYASISSIPAGIVSGSSQILGGSGLFSSSVQIGNYVATITGTTNQITVAGSGLNNAGVTLSTPQNIHSAATPTFAGLTINGAITATGDITAYYTSDERLKENIQPIQNALSKVETISGNEYNWKEGFDEIHTKKGNDIGVIAQEIQKILPQAVIERDNGYLGVNYEKIIPLLIESIKELSAKVKELENK